MIGTRLENVKNELFRGAIRLESVTQTSNIWEEDVRVEMEEMRLFQTRGCSKADHICNGLNL